ncbi:ABC transporter substrate-binding protein [[Mycoplasma] collis]|uniref:ABC transporter substrate-binding protein n=1 Tax=[Mycoplasma] collis TaxID=2127 RepID=UPI00051BE8F4|nr:ABC transporter substrate-binding protein [[Mycoplasma] collis]
MLKKKKKLKTLLTLFSLGLVSLSSIVTMACSNKKDNESSLYSNEYDLGLVAPPLNNLNYIKYKSVSKVLPTLVEAFTKEGPSRNLKNILPISKFIFHRAQTNLSVDENNKKSSDFNVFYSKSKENLSKNDGYGGDSNSFYNVTDFGFLGGLGRSSSGDFQNSSLYLFPNPKNPNIYMGFTSKMNEKLNFWSNGEVIEAKDLRDYLEYILDNNTGSQKKDEILKFGLRGANEFVQAQNDYVSKFGKLYSNPWGRRRYILNSFNEYIQDPEEKVWQSQNKGDEEDVEKIKKAALNFGFYTGQLFLDYTNKEIEDNLKFNENFNLNSNEAQEFKFLLPGKKGEKETDFKKVKIIKNVFLNPYQEFEIVEKDGKKIINAKQKILAYNENDFTVIYDENNTQSLGYLINHTSRFFPVNRKFIETVVGGIDKFGSSYDKFLTTGAFNLDKDMILGPNGYLKLNKNSDYFDEKNVIPNKIKITFSTDPNISTILFEDKHISQSYVPASKILKYYSDIEYRGYLKKNSGYGTIAFAFNLDDETNKNPYLKDNDLRKAIQLFLKRTDAIKFVGWDFSLPTSMWTAYGQSKADDGKNIETFFEGLDYKEKNDKVKSVLDFDFLKHSGKNFNLENIILSDHMYDPKTALFYLKRFKNKYPDLKKLTINYIENSTDEQKKAGIFLKESIRIGLKDTEFENFIEIDTKALPENTYASYVEEGKFDIIYGNYDYIGGSSPQDYIAAFFKSDEINTLNQKNIGFRLNPVGSFTYETYLSELFLEELQKENNQLTRESVLNEILTNLKNSFFSSFNSKIKETQKENSNNKYGILTKEILNFLNKNKDLYLKNIPNLSKEELEKIYSPEFLLKAVEYLILSDENSNKKQARIKRLFSIYILEKYGTKEIANKTRNTAERLNFEQLVNNSETKINSLNLWNKFVELSFQKNNEDGISYSSRINSFFTSNFTDEEVSEELWETDWLYPFIGSFEKIIKDSAIVIPLMEVDTNWEISRVAGVSSLYTFSLQYAYDYTKPPRPGLPKTKGDQ